MQGKEAPMTLAPAPLPDGSGLAAPVPMRARRLPPGRQVHVPGRGEVFVREAEGPPGAPVLVLLHGWTSTADINWFNALHVLGEHYRVIAPDLRGHRGGPRGRAWATLTRCADDVAALIETLGVTDAAVVGYSMGGAIAQVLARRYPDLVSSLVLCAAGQQYCRTTRETVRFAGVALGALVARMLPASVTTGLAQRTMDRMFGRTDFQVWVGEQTAAHSWREVLEVGVSLGLFDSRSWVGKLRQPVHVVLTDDDCDVPTARQHHLAAATGAVVHVVAGGHSVCLSRPDLFLPALLKACEGATNVAVGLRSAPRPSAPPLALPLAGVLPAH
jgi:3-oxoadipate enol-lactonase